MGATPSATPLLDGTASLKHFDIVVANPPFSLEKWGFEGPTRQVQPLSARGVPPRTKGDYAFILHYDRDHEARHRSYGGGRAAWRAVPWRRRGPHSPEADRREPADAVIGLPEKLFYGTGIPAAVLVFRKNKAG